MIRLSLALAASLAATAPTSSAPVQQSSTEAASSGVSIRTDGLVGTWFPPAGGKRGPAILVIGGSEGGETGSRRVARAFAEQGYGAFALAWFKAPGLPEQLQDVPLEYFDKAVDWLEAHALVDAKRVGLYGISKGGEAALLVATRRPDIRAVVAAVPSSVVWQGINPADYTQVRSSFSLAGKPVAFLPYDMGAPFTSILDLYQRSLRALPAHAEAAIPVERIAGPVLLLSGRADLLWPSSDMADQVMARLDARRFAHAHEHIAYADAGHGATVPVPAGVAAPDSAVGNMGGTDAGNAFARRDAWARMLAFYARALGVPAR